MEDKVLINHDYDEIMLYDVVSYSSLDLYAGKYFKARIGNKWSLYSLDTGNKDIDKVFDKIYLLDKNTIAVYDGEYISFIDYKGNNVSDDKIKVSNLFESMPKLPEGISLTFKDLVVEISISEGTDYNNRIFSRYSYNLDTKVLEKISD